MFQFERKLKKGRKLDMTPLIDIIFQLVLFFMLTTTFVKQEAIDIFVNDTSNPNILTNEPTEIATEPDILITLKANKILVNSVEIEKEELAKQLKSQFEKDNKHPVKIITQKGVSVQNMITAIDIVRSSGAVNITIDDGKNLGNVIGRAGTAPSDLPELPDLQSTKDTKNNNAGSFDFDKLQNEFSPQPLP